MKIEKLNILKQQAMTCTRCPVLVANRTRVVFGEGNPDARVLICGEAAGRTEDLEGRPFCGRAGKLLDSIIVACGWKRDEVYITNTILCRPPNNRVPDPDEIYNCSNFLVKTIEIVNPEFILCLGSVASNTIVGLPISEARGKWFYHKHHKVLAIYHPAFLLRRPEMKSEVWKDLQLLLEAMKNAQV